MIYIYIYITVQTRIFMSETGVIVSDGNRSMTVHVPGNSCYSGTWTSALVSFQSQQ